MKILLSFTLTLILLTCPFTSAFAYDATEQAKPEQTEQERKDMTLREAARANSFDEVQAALKQRANPNARHVYYNLPLFWAAWNGSTKIAKILLDAGAKINAMGFRKDTALMRAAHFGHTDTVALLLGRGADVNLQDKDGYTALMICAVNGYVNTLTVLLDFGADLSFRNNMGETAYSIARRNGHRNAARLIRKWQKKPKLQSL